MTPVCGISIRTGLSGRARATRDWAGALGIVVPIADRLAERNVRLTPRGRTGARWHTGGVESLLDRALDLEDLYATPEDGNRYEILDGALVMSPPPGSIHQIVAAELAALLREGARAEGLRALFAPLAWRIGSGQVPEPDLMVVTPDAIGPRAIERPPVLVVEILSASGRGRDLSEKRRIYAEGRAAWYWIVDPDEPSLTVLRLVGDAYEDEARVTGSEAYDTEQPFPVRVVPADLLR
jgi:Uma2 family endonuclease